jgi:hypothetical protein
LGTVAEREPLAHPDDRVLRIAEDVFETDNPAVDNAMTEIGILAGVVLLLSLATFLVRRKEREPQEEEEPGAG